MVISIINTYFTYFISILYFIRFFGYLVTNAVTC